MLRYTADVDISTRNALNLPCVAAHLLELECADDLTAAFERYPQCKANFLVLGEASNVILPAFLDAYVLHFSYQPAHSVRVLSALESAAVLDSKAVLGSTNATENSDKVFVEVDAGVIWDEFVEFTVAQGWYGLENLSLIPGSVGAAPIQNIGAYGVEVADSLIQVQVFNVQSQKIQVLDVQQCEFAYRDSVFKREPGRYIILKLIFCLHKRACFKLDYGELAQLNTRNNLTAADVRQQVIAARQAKLPDPNILPNAGSFFKNPLVSAEKAARLKLDFPGLVAYPQSNGEMKLAAGWLIEQAGWKGFRNRHVGVHDRQALVLINHHHGTQADLLSLADEIKASIKQRYDILLDIEPLVMESSK